MRSRGRKRTMPMTSRRKLTMHDDKPGLEANHAAGSMENVVNETARSEVNYAALVTEKAGNVQ